MRSFVPPVARWYLVNASDAQVSHVAMRIDDSFNLPEEIKIKVVPVSTIPAVLVKIDVAFVP